MILDGHYQQILFKLIQHNFKILFSPGICDELRSMSLQEFNHASFTPMDFSHSGPGSRSPEDLRGGKVAHDTKGKLSGTTLGLHKVEQYYEAGTVFTEVSVFKGCYLLIKI